MIKKKMINIYFNILREVVKANQSFLAKKKIFSHHIKRELQSRISNNKTLIFK